MYPESWRGTGLYGGLEYIILVMILESLNFLSKYDNNSFVPLSEVPHMDHMRTLNSVKNQILIYIIIFW